MTFICSLRAIWCSFQRDCWPSLGGFRYYLTSFISFTVLFLWLGLSFVPSVQCLLPLARMWTGSLTLFQKAPRAKQFFCTASTALLAHVFCPSSVFEHRALYSGYRSTSTFFFLLSKAEMLIKIKQSLSRGFIGVPRMPFFCIFI